MTLPVTPSFRLDGKRALVAGASSGIGEACAVAMAEAGAHVTLAARRADKLTELARALTARGWAAETMPLDVADIAATEDAVAAHGPFDILVNSAGLARHSPSLETKESDFDSVADLNVKGAYFLTRAVAKGLIDAGKPGSLINISSQMAHVGGVDRAVYCATKHAVEGFTKSFAIEWGRHNIRVNTVCPTFIRTALTVATFDNPERIKWIEEKIKLGRVGEVEDMMGPVIFLASDASAMVTGSSLLVDGGLDRGLMGKSKITSLEVARRAGVSQSAVSRVFTSGASVSEKMDKKVRLAADDLGYRPNPIARAMITGKSRIIGLVFSYLDNQFYPLALENLIRALKAHGYHTLVFMAENSTKDVDDVVKELVAYQVEGIIAASVDMSNDLATLCEATGIPVVLFNRGQDDSRLSEVTSDNVAGGRMVANFLVGAGHKRIAHISGWQGSSTGRDRAKGFLEGLSEKGVEPVAVEDGAYDQKRAGEITRQLFSGSDQPDAIFVGNDHMAFAVMDVLRFEFGASVPNDVSVVGYDDVPIASWPAYDLTTIQQPINQMVSSTVDTIVARIGGEPSPKHILIPGPLILRGSARKPKGFCA